MAVNRYEYRRLTPEAFGELLGRSTLTVSEFLSLTGRRRDQLQEFLRGSHSRGFTPTLGDALILELAALDPANIDDMREIAARYLVESGQKEEERANG